MKEQIIKLLKKALNEKGINLKEKEIEKFLEIPPSLDMGDYAFPCFFLAEKLKQEPKQIALAIREKIGTPSLDFDDIQTSGPYINFFLNRKDFARQLISDIAKQKNNFGKLKKTSEKVMVEFSQPNTHKAFHVGHIRGTSLGESLSRILGFCGVKVIRANYSGDTGMHVAKWIWCYKKYHSKTKLKKDESWIASIYVDAVKRLSQNEKLQKQADIINKKIEDKSDKEINKLWQKSRKFSIDSWGKIYNELNTKFNIYYFESEVEKKGKEIAKELVKKGIAKISEGATIINLKKYDLGVWVLLRSDGTVLYSAKDIALAEKKYKKYDLDSSFYVVANEQDFHMKQLFKTLELMKFREAKNMKHISYGMVKLPEGKMSSRTGNNILYSDFIKEVSDFAKKRIKERILKISKSELEKRALIVSIAAIKYAMLKQNAMKTITFKKEDALNFEGDTGPYLLYSYARASSILKKSKSKLKTFKIINLAQKEFELVNKISKFQEVVLNAYKNSNPALVANYSYSLAQTFNEFYHAHPVIGAEQESFRLALVGAFRQTMKNSLNLLGINVLEKM